MNIAAKAEQLTVWSGSEKMKAEARGGAADASKHTHTHYARTIRPLRKNMYKREREISTGGIDMYISRNNSKKGKRERQRAEGES